MRAYTHGGWAHRQRVSTVFWLGKTLKYLLCSVLGSNLWSWNRLDLEANWVTPSYDSFVHYFFKFDLSSAFNAIQPHLMAAKLLAAMNVCDIRIVDFLAQRTQSVRFQTSLSSPRSVSAGSPTGTVLSHSFVHPLYEWMQRQWFYSTYYIFWWLSNKGSVQLWRNLFSGSWEVHDSVWRKPS